MHLPGPAPARTLDRILELTLGSGTGSSVPVSSIMHLMVALSLATSSSTSNISPSALRSLTLLSAIAAAAVAAGDVGGAGRGTFNAG